MATLQQLKQLRQNPNVIKFLDLLAYTEGTQKNGYYTAFGGGRLPHLNDHPRYLKSFSQTNGKINKTSAAGRYQFLRGTWDGLAKRYGFKDFGAENQDLGAIALLIDVGAIPYIIKGNWQQAVEKSGGTWASLPSSKHPQPTKSWQSVNKFLGGQIPLPKTGVQTSIQSSKPILTPIKGMTWNEFINTHHNPTTQGAKTLFFGDSIAHGYRMATNMGGTTKVGASPKQVLKQLQNALADDPNAFLGANVVLSSGLSNGDDVASVKKQVQLLKQAGATVSLLGVSDSFNVGGRTGNTMNAILDSLAKEYKVAFRGGFVAGKDGIHPKSYHDFVMPLSVGMPQVIGRSEDVAQSTLTPIDGMTWGEFVAGQSNTQQPSPNDGNASLPQQDTWGEFLSLIGGQDDVADRVQATNTSSNHSDERISVGYRDIEQGVTVRQPYEWNKATQGYGTFDDIKNKLAQLHTQGYSPQHAIYHIAQGDDKLGLSIKEAYRRGMTSDQLSEYFGVNELWQPKTTSTHLLPLKNEQENPTMRF